MGLKLASAELLITRERSEIAERMLQYGKSTRPKTRT